MNEADRIRTKPCGCRYDAGSGTLTHYCKTHHAAAEHRGGQGSLFDE